MKKSPYLVLSRGFVLVRLHIRSSRKFINQPVAILLIASLISTTLLLVPARGVKANSASSPGTHAPPPNNAPPEPFIIHGADSGVLLSAFSSVSASASSFADKTKELINGPAIPDGLGAAHALTLTERMTSAFASAIPKIALSAAPPPPPPSPTPAGVVNFDFDGDGKADYGRWHGGTTEFKVKNSSGSGGTYACTSGTYNTCTIGSSSAKAAPGDYDGDGKTDEAVFNAGTWTIKKSTDGSTQTISWGTSGDIPVAGDYDGDGKTDAAVFRPSTSVWWVLKSSNGSYTSTTFGSSGDIPVPGNYDGDAYSDMAVFRPSTGYWYVQGSTAGYYGLQWGLSTDIPAAADFDGDGKTDATVFRPSTGVWYSLKSSSTTGQYTTQAWGNYGDQPAPADYDGDGKADFCVWRPTTGVWYTIKSNGGSDPYSYESLGVAGDQAVSSAYIKQIGASIPVDDLAAARLAPRNATGGMNLYSQNFSWGTQLVGLPGRAGLDMGFGLSYNSLIWTKVGTAMYFDADNSNVSPGFKLGFPTIEPAFMSGKTGNYSYLMITPSGGRVEFRQTAASDTYDTADSSYSELKTTGATNPNDPVEGITIKVRTTDGTEMYYEWKGGAFRCQKITDSNGNYITISHDDEGILRSITDTLGREVDVNYDSSLYPTSITQTWKTSNGAGSGTTTHTWASFTYTYTDGATGNAPAINTNFGSMTVVGPPNSTVLKVLQKVTYPDGSYTKFSYNNYAQVVKVQNYAYDNSELNHTLLADMETVSTSTAASDCPRFTQTKTFAENFNSGSEVTVNNTFATGQSYTLPDSSSASGAKIEIKTPDSSGTADALQTVIYSASSGWAEGLPVLTEDYDTESSTLVKKRWNWTKYTQENTSLTYPLNPRVTETQVGDGTNTKKTTLDYLMQTGSSTVTQYGLVSAVKVYDTDLSTVLKTQTTTYNLDSNLVSKRIIGLPQESDLWQGTTSGTLMSKVTFAYDESGYTGTGQSVSPGVGHDNTNFGTSFSYRGNRTSSTRWDVRSGYESNSSYAISSSVKYNTAGLPISQIDPRGRVTTFSYTDSWNDSVSRTTYAYPTTLTDANGNSSTIIYRYDIGANVEATSPAPAGNSHGKKSKRTFDSIGRLERDAIWKYNDTSSQWEEYSYVRYEFPDNGVQSKVYSTVTDTNSNGHGDSSDEVLTESWRDGAGRVRQSRVPDTFNTDGSTATWSGTVTEYNILGQVNRQSVPTEVNSSWTAAGDDATRGFVWTYQKYDWKGRVIRTIQPDGDPNASDNDSDILISYEGCGCAGGQVTTIQSERVPRTDTSGNARRVQKIYEDILGREYKTETYSWDGTTVYSTVVNTFNGRDQVTQTREYSGSTSSSTYQDTTMSYDGHARLASSHRPEQRDSSGNLTYTTYTYNPDDTIHSVTDGRGAMTTSTYGYADDSSSSQHLPLLTKKSYSVPSSSGITDPSDVTFTYDALANRTQMTDGLGTKTYSYDSLSRMTSESRAFTATDTGLPSNTATLNYTYSISGQLKSYELPFYSDLTVSYAFDKLGRLSSATGTTSSNSYTYANNPHYRAWGALSHLDYGNGTEMNITAFSDRLQATAFNVKKGTTQIINKSYEYYSDGLNKKDTDNLNAKFDRLYSYDFGSRLITALTGAEARGSTDSVYNLPYHASYQYDAFGHTSYSSEMIFAQGPMNYTTTYTNNRLSGTSYDSQGNRISDSSDYKYDAADRLEYEWNYISGTIVQEWYGINGDGQIELITKTTDDGTNPPSTEKAYRVYSTPLNGTLVWDNGAGTGGLAFVYAGGSKIATYLSSTFPLWNHSDPNQKSFRSTGTDGSVYGLGLDRTDWDQIETDPDGTSVGFSDPGLGNPSDSYNLYESGWSFGARDGRTVISAEAGGIHVPPEYSTGGSQYDRWQLDLLYISAEASRQVVGYRFRGADGFDHTYSPYAVPVRAIAGAILGNFSVETIYNANWAINWSIFSGDTPVPIPDNFKDLVKERLGKKQPGQTKSCNDFLAEIIAKAVENANKKRAEARKNSPGSWTGPDATVDGKDGYDLLDKVSKFTLVPSAMYLGGDTFAGGTVKGSIKGKDAEVLLVQEKIWGPPIVTPAERQLQIAYDEYIHGVIHELTHLSSSVAGDTELLQAVIDLGYTTEKLTDPKDPYRELKDSGKWDRVLQRFCGPRISPQ